MLNAIPEGVALSQKGEAIINVMCEHFRNHQNIYRLDEAVQEEPCQSDSESDGAKDEVTALRRAILAAVDMSIAELSAFVGFSKPTIIAYLRGANVRGSTVKALDSAFYRLGWSFVIHGIMPNEDVDAYNRDLAAGRL